MLRLAAVAAAIAASAAAQNPLQLMIAEDGEYTLSAAGWSNFVLQSAPVAVSVGGTWLSSTNGTLTLNGTETYTGADAWGSWNATVLSWVAGSMPVIMTTFRVYNEVPAIGFEAAFPTAFATGADFSAYADQQDVIASFPAWELPGSSPLSFMQHYGPFIDAGSNGPKIGEFNANADFAPGLQGGPVVLFDATGQSSVVLSAASEFMAVSAAGTQSNTRGNGKMNALRFGPMGSVADIPQWWGYSTVAWYGAGINGNMMAWGNALMAKHGKAHGLSKGDFTNTHLGYNTDHGAYYYYTTGNYSNYSTALQAVAAYAQEVGIPYKHVLLDSWWYFKGLGDGVLNWTAMPSVFTGGNAGIRALVEETGWKIIAHNRYWAKDTTYAKQNGGQWDFFIDSAKGRNMAVPLQQEFWEYLLQSSVTEWGLTTYEQDWLYNELEGVDALLTNVTLGRQWLLQMGAGAETAGVSIQMCMPYPRHVLQSIEMPTVTQTRASDDHVPGANYYHNQWKLGFSSMLAWAVGLGPFKDNFFSTPVQPGGSVGTSVEFSPSLHNAISVFSAGPVTPGDGVGYSDVPQIMRSCAVTGRLLQPSRAMTALDSQVLGRAYPGAAGTTAGEVYATYSLVSGWAWDHVLAAALNASYVVTPSDLAAIRADIPLRDGGRKALGPAGLNLLPPAEAAQLWGRVGADQGAVAYSVNASTFDITTLKVKPFDAANGIPLTPCYEVDFQMWHTAPVFSNGWALLGDLTKWVPVAEARFNDVTVNGDDTTVELVGQAGEAVPVSWYDSASGKVTTVNCVLPESGVAQVIMPYGLCQPA